MILLDKVTLLSVNCIDAETTVRALNYSSRKLQFGAVKLLSSYCPSNLTANIQWEQISQLDLPGYSKFILNELYKYIETDYCLIIQTDGFVHNPYKWSEEFYNYDYIGAPWPVNLNKDRVGNGGFSLRSRKLIELTKDLVYNGQPEDVEICSIYREQLVNQGMRFAPVEVAGRFSLEHRIPECRYDLSTSFGFHGKWFKEILDLLTKE